MKENETIQKRIKNKEKGNFNIVVTYAKNGQSFQKIAEGIIMRKINEIK